MMNFNQFVNENEIDNIFNHVKDYISKNNKTDNAYHNNKHMIDVFNNSMTLFDEYQAYRVELKILRDMVKHILEVPSYVKGGDPQRPKK